MKGIIRSLIIFLLVLFLSSCNSISKIEEMIGTKNSEFEYLKNTDNINEIIVENARDEKFKFIITDKYTISDIYDMLSRGKVVLEKSEFKPDYIFTIEDVNGNNYKYYYVAGNFTSIYGNFYDDNNKIFYISDALDKNIINNFLILRKPPQEFNEIYYDCIIQAINKYYDENKDDINKPIAIDLYDDVEYRRFIFSYDVNNFVDKLQQMNLNFNVYDTEKPIQTLTMLSVNTIGFDETTYECKYTFTKDQAYESYTLRADYKDKKWDTNISKDDASQ